MEEEAGFIGRKKEGGDGAEYALAADRGAGGIASRRRFIQLGLGALALSVAGETVWCC